MNRIYEVAVFHHRATPVVHQVRQRGYLWYVDVDQLPRFPLLARFDAADHLGDPRASLRANVEALLAERGIHLPGGRITMLTNARSLGYVFNPLTLFWCHDASGVLSAVVAEVHNTYGHRHAYLLRPDARGDAETEKSFYVSPFYPVDGYYQMSVPEPDEQLAVAITLCRDEGRPFIASVRGVSRPATWPNLLRLAIRYPFLTQRIRTAITGHGLRLYLKGLPVMARPGRPGVAAGIAQLVNDLLGIELPLRLRAWDGSESGPVDGPVLVLRSRRALRRIAARPGELGLARAYVTGDLDIEGDLTEGLRRARSAAGSRTRTTVRRRLAALPGLIRLGVVGWPPPPPPPPPAGEARIPGHLHARARDRAVIAHHYDLSNDFFRLLLDDSMAYSAAYFTAPDQPLAAAQQAKFDLICGKLRLKPGLRLLDVGCGWGSLILHAAEQYGVHATGVTLSEEQHDFILKRIADRGLTDRVTVRLGDYRELVIGEPYDAVSSIEMGEHVGPVEYPNYAAILTRALRPGGRLLIQQMSRPAGAAPGGGPFIKAYIAPDMHMRPASETIALLEGAGLQVIGLEAMRMHYVYTARAWLAKLDANYDAAVELVGDELVRAWRLYLTGGALSFEQGRVGVDQIAAVRPR